MSDHATLHVVGGARRWTRDQLATLEPPERTRTWLPVRHHDLVTGLVDGLVGRGITIVDEQYCTTGPGDGRLLGVLDLHIPGLATPEYRMGLALKAGNDRKTAVRLLAAARVTACSNQMISGSEGAVCLRKKHTSGFDVARVVPEAIDSFLTRAGKFKAEIEAMQEILLGDDRAKELLFDAFCGPRPVGPIYLLPRVAKLYFDDEEQRGMFPERSLWSLNQGFTQALKLLRPAPAFQAGLNVGRFFAALVPGEPTPPIPAQLAAPAGWDAVEADDDVELKFDLDLPAPAPDPDEDADWDIASNW